MSEELQQKLRNQLWTVANTLRGNMSAGDFMYYTLGFIFYKYLSEKIEKAADEVLQEDGMTFKEAWASNDEELKEALKEECIQNLGYFVEPEFLYSTIISMIDRKENILPALGRSLKKIEDSTLGQDSEDDFGVYWIPDTNKGMIDNGAFFTGKCCLLDLDTFESHIFEIEGFKSW